MKTLNRPYYRPRVYLSSKVRAANHARNNTVASHLRGLFDIFVPHSFQSGNEDHENIELSVYMMDVTAMEHSDLAVLVAPFGKDCCWEVGWLVARNKPVFLYTNEDLTFLGDAMTCGGLTAVFTENISIFNRLMLHPVLKTKTHLLGEARELGVEVMRYFNDLKGGRILMEG